MGNGRLAVTFVNPDGERNTFQVREGDSLLDIAQEHGLDLEGVVFLLPFLTYRRL
jgi:hypothetical protein